MGDRKQQGDSEYGDSDYEDPRGLDFLRREEHADNPEEVREEPRPLTTSSLAKASCIVAEGIAAEAFA